MSSLESQFYGLHIAYQEALWGAAAIINFELRVLPPKICPRHGIWGRVRGRAPRGFYEPASHIHPEPSNNNFGCENIADAPPGHRWDAFDRATSEPPLSAVFRHPLVAIARVRLDKSLAAFTRLYPGEYLRVKACAKSGWSVQRNRVALDHKVGNGGPAGDRFGDNGHYISYNFSTTPDPKTNRHGARSPYKGLSQKLFHVP